MEKSLNSSFLEFVHLKKNTFEHFIDFSKVYGPIYTFWIGNMPMVMIHDLEIAKEAFLDIINEIAGRPEVKLC